VIVRTSANRLGDIGRSVLVERTQDRATIAATLLDALLARARDDGARTIALAPVEANDHGAAGTTRSNIQWIGAVTIDTIEP
jgi:hypothetical protein